MSPALARATVPIARPSVLGAAIRRVNARTPLEAVDPALGAERASPCTLGHRSLCEIAQREPSDTVGPRTLTHDHAFLRHLLLARRLQRPETMQTTLVTSLLDDPRLARALRAALPGPPLVQYDVHTEHFQPCTGCFSCWVETPGRCKAGDAANDLMADLAQGGLQVWAGHVRFGTWEPGIKRALDKCLGLLSPLADTDSAGTTHASRYGDYPRMLVVGVLDDEAPVDDEALFRTVATREALHLLAPSRAVVVLRRSTPPEEVARRVSAAVATLEAAPTWPPRVSPLVRPPQPEGIGVPPRTDRPRRARLLIGSLKPPGTSASEALGGRLITRLARRGWHVDAAALGPLVRADRGAAAAFADDVELLVVATPVFVDTLPAIVTQALHALVDLRPPLSMLGMVHCGFPEEEHTWPAVRVLEAAARDGGIGWVGALTAGAAALGPDETPVQADGLDRVADALDAGQCVPVGAAACYATPRMSAPVYRMKADLGWIAEAWRRGGLTHLAGQPFAGLAPVRVTRAPT